MSILKFDKESVHIIFNDGKESIYYYNKRSAIMALGDCLIKKRITEAEYHDFVKQVYESNLPLDEEKFIVVIRSGRPVEMLN